MNEVELLVRDLYGKYAPNNFSEEETIDIKKELSYYAFFWPYFLGLVLVALFGAYTFLRYEYRIYQTSAQLQIKKGDSDPTSFLTEGAQGLLNFDKVNVENDIAVITSNRLLNRVVDRLDLQTTVVSKGRIASMLQFNDKLPFRFDFEPETFFESATLEVNNGQAKFVMDDQAYDLKPQNTLYLEGFTLTPQDTLFTTDAYYEVSRSYLIRSVEAVRTSLEVTAASKQGEVVNISFKGSNTVRNEAIVNTLIEVLKQHITV